MIKNNNVLKIALVLWVVVAFIYLDRTPLTARSHDWDAHVQYTDFIVNKHHFPTPYEGFHTYHPPLYYLLVSVLLPPNLRDQDSFHHFARALSVVFGAITLWIIQLCLKEVNKDPKSQLLVLLFIATTPKFVFVFSTFNNDSLVTLLCMAVAAVCYKLCFSWSWRLAGLLLILTTMGIYTKYTFIFCALVICFILLCALFFRKPFNPHYIRIIGIFLLSLLFFVPWMIFHNYHFTEKLIPTSFDYTLHKVCDIDKAKQTLTAIFQDSLTNSFSNKWSDPWAHGYERRETKQHDYLSFSFVTSVFGEFVYNTPHISYIWTVLWIHLLTYIIGIREIFRSNITKLAGSFIFLTHLVHVLNISRIVIPFHGTYGCFMDYRYICWSWIAWIVLYGNSLLQKSNLSWILDKLFFVGIIIQFYILFTITGSDT